MFTFDLLIPWITLAATLVPLLYVQRWIHRHLFGVGYLISREKSVATFFYYLFLLPGVILHQISRYLVAGMFHVPAAYFMFFPEAQEDGSLEMGFIRLAAVKNPIYAAFIGLAPFLSGLAVVVLISNSALDLPTFFSRIQTSDIYEIGAAIQDLVSKPDFLLWSYLLFAVANTMMPNAEDRLGWWLIAALGSGILLFLIVIGMYQIVVAWLAGPMTQVLYSLSAVFGTVLFLDCFAVIITWVIEAILERVTGHKVEYAPAQPRAIAAPARPSLTSVYQLNLPLPPPPGRVTPVASPRLAPAAATPEFAPQPARPAFSQPAMSRPALTGGESSRPEDKPRTPAIPAPSAPPAARPSIASPTTPPASRPFSPAARTDAVPGGRLPGTAGTSGTSGTSGTGNPPAAKPASPLNQPSKPFGGSPPRPGPFGSPAAPKESPSKPGDTAGKPPGSVPSALSRPGGGPPVPAKPNIPAPASPNRPAPPPGRSPFGTPSRPSKINIDKDDFIDADVIEDDSDEDDDEPKYVSLDDV